ncbi:MAG: phosphatidate cytidylyltransferase [Bacteroidota bacterium]
MKNFFTRTLTAGAFVAVLLGCTYYSRIAFSVLFFIITILGLLEFYNLVGKSGAYPQKLVGTAFGGLIFLLSALICSHNLPPIILVLTFPIIALVFILELFRNKEKPFSNIGFTLLGLFYVAIPFSMLNFITTSKGTYNFTVLFGVFFILWCNDAGAYIVGSLIGKHKLFPRISPAKSWEGSIGGALISYAIVFIISGWYTSISFFDWLIIATILIVIGTLGDLVESLFKRSINVKDSGTLLPGHGGILDRFDSLIISTPFIFAYLYLIQIL